MPRAEVGPPIAGGARPGMTSDHAAVELYDHLLQVCLLLLLRETPATCSQLREGLRPLGFEQTAGVLESVLDTLASDGLVAAGREAPAGDRVHQLTIEGASWLRHAAAELRRTEVVLGGFLARCSERFVTRA